MIACTTVGLGVGSLDVSAGSPGCRPHLHFTHSVLHFSTMARAYMTHTLDALEEQSRMHLFRENQSTPCNPSDWLNVYTYAYSSVYTCTTIVAVTDS